MPLRELTHEKHKQAESHVFVRQLFSGQLPPHVYADFLFNKMLRYSVLEHRAHELHLFDDLSGIERSAKMLLDLTTLSEHHFVRRASTDAYIQHVSSLTDPAVVMAHVYTLHMGDMYGGQMMKELVPTPGHMFEFADRASLIAAVRGKLTDDMADEANRAFDFAIQLFDELQIAHQL